MNGPQKWSILGELPAQVQEILFAVMAAKPVLGQYPGVEPTWLAEKILKDRLPVRLQLQLHKLLWGLYERAFNLSAFTLALFQSFA